MDDTILTLDEVEALARDTLVRAGASDAQAASVARSTRLAERDGIRSHGLMYVPIYAEHLRCGKVLGDAEPSAARPRPGAVAVDAAHGFAHPAIDAGMPLLAEAARENGVAAMTVRRSYNCGVLGHHAERLAEQGLVALCFTHAPASMAPPGGTRPVVGTNPFALSVPGEGGVAFTIDQSASAIAKSEIVLRARANEPIEPGWALDATGQPTTDANEALQGTMVPAGGAKGFNVGLLVEVLASCLAGAVSSVEASPFSGPKGGPPATGQCFLAFDPAAFADGFGKRVEALVATIENNGDARLPNSRKTARRASNERDGVRVDAALLERIRAA